MSAPLAPCAPRSPCRPTRRPSAGASPAHSRAQLASPDASTVHAQAETTAGRSARGPARALCAGATKRDRRQDSPFACWRERDDSTGARDGCSARGRALRPERVGRQQVVPHPPVGSPPSSSTSLRLASRLSTEHVCPLNSFGPNAYSCNCMAWSISKGRAIDARSCKHLRQVLGDEYVRSGPKRARFTELIYASRSSYTDMRMPA